MQGAVRQPDPNKRLRHRLFEPVDRDGRTCQTSRSACHIPLLDDRAPGVLALPGRGNPAIFRKDGHEEVGYVLRERHLPDNPDRTGTRLLYFEASRGDIVCTGGLTWKQTAEPSGHQQRCEDSM